MKTSGLSSLTAPHPLTKEFKGVSNKSNQSSQTPGSFFSFSKPHPFPEATEIAHSKSMLKELGLKNLDREDIQFLSGVSPKSDQAFVTRYGGHQFGRWAGQLGDGRAHTLGRFDDKWDIQVKGSGPSPYSRNGDGYAVLRSSLREFLMSEYMHHLGVPTTRALNLISSGKSVLRDMFYDGNTAYEPGALVTRMAPSFLRFGHFQIFEKNGEVENLEKLTTWTIANHFPNHKSETDEDLFEWFDHICTTSLDLVVDWMRVGFVHGVLNTDNMSIHGITIDYGPFSMLDEYDRSFTSNTTDLPGRRYSYENQPAVFMWNLERLANALTPLVADPSGFAKTLNTFKSSFQNKFEIMFQNKLGLPPELADPTFIMITENLLQDLELDFTLFFSNIGEDTDLDQMRRTSYKTLDTAAEKRLSEYIEHYRFLSKKIKSEQKESLQKKRLISNPKFNLRNYIFVEILDELEKGSTSKLEKVMRALENPYSTIVDCPELYAKRPHWAKDKPGCTFLSCSS